MKDDHPLASRLAAMVRRTSAFRPEPMPPGFDTRLLARLREDRGRTGGWETLAPLAAGAACALAIAVHLLPAPTDEQPDEIAILITQSLGPELNP